jgi:Inositol polyphosphate kinase
MQKYEHAAGGSGRVYKRGKRIYKRYSEREYIFYRDILPSLDLAEFVPAFVGTLDLSACGGGKFLILEDVNEGLESFSSMDLKLGTTHWTHSMDAEKVERKIARNASTTSSSMGARLGGIIGEGRIDKKMGRSMGKEDLEHAIRGFLKDRRQRKALAKSLVALRNKVSSISHVRFCGASLLISRTETELRVALLDFGNVRTRAEYEELPQSTRQNPLFSESFHGPDTGTILGLDFIIRVLSGDHS